MWGDELTRDELGIKTLHKQGQTVPGSEVIDKKGQSGNQTYAVRQTNIEAERRVSELESNRFIEDLRY